MSNRKLELRGICNTCKSKEHVVHVSGSHGNTACTQCNIGWYQNHCVNPNCFIPNTDIRTPIDSRFPDNKERCSVCGYYICPACGSHGCTIERVSEEILISDSLYDSELINSDNECPFCPGVVHGDEDCPNEPDPD